MARRINSGEALPAGVAANVGTGHAIRFLPASKQFDTRTCARCAGLLVNEWYYDMDNTGEHNVEILRCVQCGHRVDPVIVQNQVLLPIETQRVRQVRHKYSAKTAVSGEGV
jgi:Zn ribbon nucleic-acid-binding protein